MVPMSSSRAGRLLGYGRTAEIFLWGDNRVLKLFRENWPPHLVEEEAKIGQAVRETGLPVPAVEGILELDGRKGIVYERVEGRTMLEQFSDQPWTILRLIRVFTELHIAIHEHSIPNLPSQRERLAEKIQRASMLSEVMREVALGILEESPDDDILCHGDFHPDQIMMSPRGPVMIDWSTAMSGNPIADVATTSLLLRLAAPTPGRISSLLAIARGFVHWRYLKGYLNKTHVSKESLDSWGLPIATARLSEGIPEERSQLLKLIEGWSVV